MCSTPLYLTQWQLELVLLATVGNNDQITIHLSANFMRNPDLPSERRFTTNTWLEIQFSRCWNLPLRHDASWMTLVRHHHRDDTLPTHWYARRVMFIPRIKTLRCTRPHYDGTHILWDNRCHATNQFYHTLNDMTLWTPDALKNVKQISLDSSRICLISISISQWRLYVLGKSGIYINSYNLR